MSDGSEKTPLLSSAAPDVQGSEEGSIERGDRLSHPREATVRQGEKKRSCSDRKERRLQQRCRQNRLESDAWKEARATSRGARAMGRKETENCARFPAASVSPFSDTHRLGKAPLAMSMSTTEAESERKACEREEKRRREEERA